MSLRLRTFFRYEIYVSSTLRLFFFHVEIVAFRIHARPIAAALFIVSFHEKLSAMGAIGIGRLVITYEVAIGIVRAAIKLLPTSALTAPSDDLAVTIGAGAICERK